MQGLRELASEWFLHPTADLYVNPILGCIYFLTFSQIS